MQRGGPQPRKARIRVRAVLQPRGDGGGVRPLPCRQEQPHQFDRVAMADRAAGVHVPGREDVEQVWADMTAVQAGSEPRAEAFGGRAGAAGAVKCRRIPPGGLQRGGVAGAQCDVTEDVAGNVVEVAGAPVTHLVGHVQDRLGFGAGVRELPGGQPCPAPQHGPDPDVPGDVLSLAGTGLDDRVRVLQPQLRNQQQRLPRLRQPHPELLRLVLAPGRLARQADGSPPVAPGEGEQGARHERDDLGSRVAASCRLRDGVRDWPGRRVCLAADVQAAGQQRQQLNAQRRRDAGQPQGRLALLSDRGRGILGHQHAYAQPRLRFCNGIGQVALRRGKEPGRLGGPAGLHEQVDGLYDCAAAPGPAARHEVQGTARQGGCHRRGRLPDLRRCPPQQAG